ncbi:uncharacterized protein PAC_09984 [Phialocephala subalpina]|uniref:Uncharacterized protein n=1 Tax=Phialocephala subalpina TaxID=576137 RepID=A0A1L7X4Y8_9HELO|nr:uncharacterized protein PAC_09984 [Phialocephala subalpina]
MLPQSLWILVISFVSSIEARSSPQLRDIRFSNVTTSNGSPSASPTSTLFSLSPSVPRSTRIAETSGTLSDIALNATSSTPSTLSSRTSIASSSSKISSETSRPLGNATLPTDIPGPCCFVIQDTVSEEWWQKTSYSSATSLVSLTSYTTYITNLPNVTSTRVETNVYLTNASFSFTFMVGQNPITNLINQAPTPTQATQVLTGAALVTAGVTMHSPQAFYVYNTVKIITADAITDREGNIFCATQSTGAHGDIFPRINENAQAYFGGPGIAGQSLIPTGTSVTTMTDTFYGTSPTPWKTTETFTESDEIDSTAYTDSAGNIVSQTSTPTGVVISLVTPFIYAPRRGKAKPSAGCEQDSDTEAYGYVPYTLIDFLANDPYYSAQYPGIESCYGGGPSIIQDDFCVNPLETISYQSAGGDLTSSTTIYVNAPSMNQDSKTAFTQPTSDLSDGASKLTLPTSDGAPLTAPPASKTTPISLYTVPPPISALQENTGETSLGAIINSFAGNTLSQGQESPITIQSATTIPLSQAPAGAVGISTNIDSTPVLIITAATTIPPPPLAQTQQPITIAALTTIPLSQAPPGAVGSTTTINNAPFLIIQPTTITPSPSLISPFATTLISGTPFVVVPPTTIPVSEAPAWVHGSTTTINGTPYLIVASRTSLQVGIPQITSGAGGFVKTTISGTVFEIIPATTIPVSLAPEGLVGSTTMINGTPYLVVGAATTLPIQQGGTTVVGGTTELIIPGPTTIPVNSLFPVSGITTVISGITMVEVTGPTTVLEMSSTSLSTSSPAVTSGGSQTSKNLAASPSAITSKSGAAPPAEQGLLWSVMGVMAAGVLIAGV